MMSRDMRVQENKKTLSTSTGRLSCFVLNYSQERGKLISLQKHKMGKEETQVMKVNDLFETTPLLTGRTEIDTVSKLNAGLIWSMSAQNWGGANPDTDEVEKDDNQNQTNLGAGATLIAPVHLPHGAKITEVIAYGLDTAETWTLQRSLIALNSGGEEVASAVFGTADSTILNPIVNNNEYCYWFFTSALDATDRLQGARIIYTL